MIWALIIIGVIVLDRIVKFMMTSGFSPGESIPVLGDFFHITYVQNTGVAFSMMAGHENIILVSTSVLLAAGLIYLFVFRRKNPLLFNVGLSLVCGGGIGNVIDRAAYGYVVDMFDFGWFPVFNVADICICVGCGLILLYALQALKDEQ